MRRALLTVALIGLTGSATMPVHAAETAPIEGTPTTVVFTMPSPRPDVHVLTDDVPSHWRTWPVRTAERLDPSERCQFRVDASRILRGKPLTQSVPRRCLTARERQQRPDPAPRG